MDDSELEALIARSLHRKADSIDIGPGDWQSVAAPRRLSRGVVGGVSVLLLLAALIGVRFARGAERLDPKVPADAPAASTSPPPASVDAEALNQAAIAAGYGSAASPSSAWLAACLTSAGYAAHYDDATASFTYAGPAAAQATCLQQLAALVPTPSSSAPEETS